MRIPWRTIGRKLQQFADWAVIVIRATGNKDASRETREPREDPSATEAFDRWKDGRP